MSAVMACQTWQEVHTKAVEASIASDIREGLALEFGVFQGKTITWLANKTGWQIDGFDSFEGLPEDWRPGFEKGAFAVGGLPDVPRNVTLHKGWFEDTLPKFLLSNDQPPVRFLHVDCDLYSSTKTVFDHLADLIVPGSVIVFDVYFNYPGWEQGEYRAFMELIQRRSFKYEYIAYNINHEQVAVLIK
jgi:hypothetical protein